ncbi:MAG: TIGR02677 family protein [Myxococcota bacterium]
MSVYILDTSVLVSGLLSRRPEAPPVAFLDLVLGRAVAVLASPELVDEYREVLLRPAVAARHGRTAGEIDVLVETLTGIATMVTPVVAPVEAPDPDDTHLWALLHARPDAVLVTGEHLLRQAGTEARPVLSPAEALVRVRRERAEGRIRLVQRPSPRILTPVPVLMYVNVEHAPTYRAIVEVFAEARQRYVVELRPAEVRAALEDSGLFHDLDDEGGLDRRLDMLCQWGNLDRTHDTEAVSRLEDFYARRYRYRLTAAGEAAHRAVQEVEATVGRSGSLQASLLQVILETLAVLARLTPEDVPDPIVRALHDLDSAFSTLTQEANRFIGDLTAAIAAVQVDDDAFVLRKEAILSYISRFVEQLRQTADRIVARIREVEESDFQAVLERGAEHPDLPPALGEGDPRGRWLADQKARWEGVRRWFVGEAGSAPTVERLADVTVEAVVGLARALGRLNDRRSRRVDRGADFRMLATWFEACTDDRVAHILWESAFGLRSARHFHIEEEDPEETSVRASWWSARPVMVPIRLRTRGRESRSGRASPVPDWSSQRELIARRRARERAQMEAALRQFTEHSPVRLSTLARLDRQGFDCLLGLVDEALTSPRASDTGEHSARTADGRYLVRLSRPQEGTLVTLECPGGRLVCLDYLLTIARCLPVSAGRREEEEG